MIFRRFESYTNFPNSSYLTDKCSINKNHLLIYLDFYYSTLFEISKHNTTHAYADAFLLENFALIFCINIGSKYPNNKTIIILKIKLINIFIKSENTNIFSLL